MKLTLRKSFLLLLVVSLEFRFASVSAVSTFTPIRLEPVKGFYYLVFNFKRSSQ